MKHFFQKSIVVATVFTFVISLSSFNNEKNEKKSTADAYTIDLMTNSVVGTNQEWTWRLTNPNPGNGLNGTLQNVSHWSVPLSAAAEAALVSAEYSFDGVTWFSLPTEVERDPSIRACTSVDVLKFNVGTVGSQPTYYRATFSVAFAVNPYAVSYIKAGVRQGCNIYTYAGISTTGQRFD